jgi:hypothetical protein
MPRDKPDGLYLVHEHETRKNTSERHTRSVLVPFDQLGKNEIPHLLRVQELPRVRSFLTSIDQRTLAVRWLPRSLPLPLPSARIPKPLAASSTNRASRLDRAKISMTRSEAVYAKGCRTNERPLTIYVVSWDPGRWVGRLTCR